MRERTCLEVCTDSFASAMAAIRGEADRLELCACLMVGGLTPDPVLLEQIRGESDIPIRCLIRPRFGDFLYSRKETEMMAEQIRRLSASGADGFAVGCLTADGELDEDTMKSLIAAADGKGITLHRAFDVCRDGLQTARRAAELGIDTILTSGQADSCWAGRAFLQKLLEEHLPLTVMAGAGVNSHIIGELRKLMPLDTFHMSGKKVLSSAMTFRREGVPMGLAGMDEFTVWQTDEAEVRSAAMVLKGEKSCC